MYARPEKSDTRFMGTKASVLVSDFREKGGKLHHKSGQEIGSPKILENTGKAGTRCGGREHNQTHRVSRNIIKHCTCHSRLLTGISDDLVIDCDLDTTERRVCPCASNRRRQVLRVREVHFCLFERVLFIAI